MHRWYPYLEGFSAGFVESLLVEFGENAASVHDPFAGTGTTPIVASQTGRGATFCEINPFMQLVVDVKTNVACRLSGTVDKLTDYLDWVVCTAGSNQPDLATAQETLAEAFRGKYLVGDRLREVVSLRRTILNEAAPDDLRDVARLALASIVVDSSQLKRSGDLRYRRPNEIGQRVVSPLEAFRTKALEIADDIRTYDFTVAPVELMCASALDTPPADRSTDLVITSPPYLNGTNYFRNTKLELWATGLMSHEDELGAYRTEAVAAGINNISKRGRDARRFPYVEDVAARLDEVAYDRRIPELVRRYFSDAAIWLAHVGQLLTPRGTAIIDIGDSRFAGVHVKTDDLLVKLAKESGLETVDRRLVRRRRSKDGTPLEQSLVILRKTPPLQSRAQKRRTSTSVMLNSARTLQAELPHKAPPLASRNWGHPWHSLCSYQGKLKPAIAHVLVREFTSPGDIVLDPMSGAGTIPLEACLQGRVGWGNDLQDLAHILTSAKVGWDNVEKVWDEAEGLIRWVEASKAQVDLTKYSEFGFNGRLPDYFHPQTYAEVLAAREYMLAHPPSSWARSLVYACVLHVLHGNRPYALSRRSHPVTPFKPGGPFEYRSLATRMVAKIERALTQVGAETAITGSAFKSDLFDLEFREQIDAVITSPPFAASTRFFSANWMRLWMAGWEPEHFRDRRSDFIEHRQVQGLGLYESFFQRVSTWLKPHGRLIMHVGRNGKFNMGQALPPLANEWFSLIHSFEESVDGRESFGISDQGSTKAHQYLFFVRR